MNGEIAFGYQFECLQIKTEGRRQSRMVTHLAAVSPQSLVFPFSNSILPLRELPGLNLLPPPMFINVLLSAQFFFIIIWIPNYYLYFQDAHNMASHDLTLPCFLPSLLLVGSVSLSLKHTTLQSCSSTTLLNREYPSICIFKSCAFLKYNLSFTSCITEYLIYYFSSFLLLKHLQNLS